MLLFLWKVYEQNKTFLKELVSLCVIWSDPDYGPVSNPRHENFHGSISPLFLPHKSIKQPLLSSITCTLEFHLVTLSHWSKCPIIHHQQPKGPPLHSSTSRVENVHNEHHRYHGNIYRNPVIQHIVPLSQCNDLIQPLLAAHCSFTHVLCAPSTSKKEYWFPLHRWMWLYSIMIHCFPLKTCLYLFLLMSNLLQTCLFLMPPWEQYKKKAVRKGKAAYPVRSTYHFLRSRPKPDGNCIN